VRVAAVPAELTTSVNLVEAVCPAEVTITVGIYVPAIVDLMAVNVSNPDGLVSLAAYISETPPGNPVCNMDSCAI